jgi:hypothetical protein
VVGVLLLGVTVLLLRGPASDDSPTTAQPAATQDGAPPATASGTTDITWLDVAGIDLPMSQSSGPWALTGERATGFHPDELGAVLAAVHISSRTGAEVGPAVYRRTIEEQVTGPGAPALLARTEADYERKRAERGVADGQPLGRAYGELLGYRVESITPGQQAVVHVLTAGPSLPGRPSTFSSRLTLVWSDGDWRLVAPSGGDWSSVVTPANTGGIGYVPLRKE